MAVEAALVVRVPFFWWQKYPLCMPIKVAQSLSGTIPLFILVGTSALIFIVVWEQYHNSICLYLEIADISVYIPKQTSLCISHAGL